MTLAACADQPSPSASASSALASSPTPTPDPATPGSGRLAVGRDLGESIADPVRGRPRPPRPLPRRRDRRRALGRAAGGRERPRRRRDDRLDPPDRRRGRSGPTDGLELVDASGATIVPGMVDCHSHVTLPGGAHWIDRIDDPPATLVEVAERNGALLTERRRPLGSRRRRAVRRGPDRRPAAGAEPRRPRPLGGAAGVPAHPRRRHVARQARARCRRPRTPSRPTTPTSCWPTRSASSTTAPTS